VISSASAAIRRVMDFIDISNTIARARDAYPRSHA